MGRVAVAFVVVLVIQMFAGFPVFSLLSSVGLLEFPQPESPGHFFLAVLVQKIGVALGFVLLFRLAAETLAGRWWLYAGVWWLMFAVIEVGQALGPGYSTAEAVAGVVAEAIYFPLSALAVTRLLWRTGSDIQTDGEGT